MIPKQLLDEMIEYLRQTSSASITFVRDQPDLCYLVSFGSKIQFELKGFSTNILVLQGTVPRELYPKILQVAEGHEENVRLHLERK
jgi:hypothetical protein